MEWLVAILPIPVIIIVAGMASIFLFNYGMDFYLQRQKKKENIGLIALSEEQRETTLRKLLARAIVPCFFFTNLCSIAAGSEIVVNTMRSVYPQGNLGIYPDPEVMWHLAWIFCIPSTLLLVPFWILRDTGLGSVKKDRETGMESVSFMGDRLYNAIQGYAGIGFVFQLFATITTFVTFGYNWESSEFVSIILMIVSPLIAIVFIFLLVIYLDRNMGRYQDTLLEKLTKHGLTHKLVSKVEIA